MRGVPSGLFQQICQAGEGTCLAFSSAGLTAIVPRAVFQFPLMFVVMTVQAQQFPVAAIGWVVVVVVVAVMDGQLVQVAAVEFARATTTDPGIELQGLLSITAQSLITGPPGCGNDLIKPGSLSGTTNHVQ